MAGARCLGLMIFGDTKCQLPQYVSVEELSRVATEELVMLFVDE